MSDDFRTTISIDELNELLQSPDLLIVDCSFTSAAPQEGYLHFLDEHIPGAVYADLNRDLASKPTPTTGRHPLPDPQAFSRLLMEWNVTDRTQVVCYDMEGGASAAARLWWLLQACGHQRTAVLSGGFPAWLMADLPLEQCTSERKSGKVLPQIYFDPSRIVYAAQVESLIHQDDWRIIDARSPLRHSGLEEVVDKNGGRIPGSISIPYATLLDDENKFLSREELTNILAAALGEVNPDHVIIYCGSSVISTVVSLAMDHIGLPGSKLYIGSWSDWITDPNHPIATR